MLSCSHAWSWHRLRGGDAARFSTALNSCRGTIADDLRYRFAYAEGMAKITQLTRVHRKILANQFTILQILKPNQSYDYLREIVEQGFEAEYEDVLRDV